MNFITLKKGTTSTAEEERFPMKHSSSVVLSGMRPTGPLHIGHLFGALTNWRRLQDDGTTCFFMVADYHALSTEYASTGRIRENVEEVALDFLAAGLDPEKATIFVQSQVPQHAELHLYFSMVVPIPWLERNPVYKEQVEELKEKDLHTYGFLGYPVLQAADILIYKATTVPIGIDQLPHVELTREIARRFNFFYGPVFPEPEALLTETPKVPGTDNRKMSKSYNNSISLKDEPDAVREKIRTMFTDPTRIHKKDAGHPDTCPVFAYHRLFNTDGSDTIRKECLGACRGCTDCKKDLIERVTAYLAPIREIRSRLAADRAGLWKILRKGEERARAVAAATLEEAKRAMGIFYA